MYTQDHLIADVEKHAPFDAQEAAHRDAIIGFLQRDRNPFERKNFAGHVTGSAWVISPDRQHVLLTHHAILDKWLQFGGHADGEANIKNVTLREAQEESGIMQMTPVLDHIFDVDVHPIPANPKRDEPEHLHYDVRYLLQSGTMDFEISSESHALQWVSIERIFTFSLSPAMLRMAEKWKNILNQ